jgi:hypothetical protein
MFKCDHCEKKFSTKGNLTKHKNKKYKCNNLNDNEINNDNFKNLEENIQIKKENAELKNEMKEIKDILLKLLIKECNSNDIKDSSINSNNNINSHNNINSNNGNNVLFNFQYIEKNFANAKNIEDVMKIENISDETYNECKNKRIKNGSTHLLKKLCIEDKEIEERAIHCLDHSRKKYAVKTKDIWKNDPKGTVIKSICEPIIETVYKKIMKELYKEKNLSSEMLSELGLEVLEYKKNDIFNKTLDDCASYLILKNSKKENENQIEDKNKNDDLDDDIYVKFMNTKTRKSMTHIHTQILYEKFVEWYKENIGDENIPSNKEFIKNIKIHFLVHKSVKVGEKVSTGIKNLELR